MNALDAYAQAVGRAQTLGNLIDHTGRTDLDVQLRRAVDREVETQEDALAEGHPPGLLDRTEAVVVDLIDSEWSYGAPAEQVVPPKS